MCVKNTAVCCLTARKSPRNSSLPLGLAIYILRKMPTKSDESSVECYSHGFLIAARPRGGKVELPNSGHSLALSSLALTVSCDGSHKLQFLTLLCILYCSEKFAVTRSLIIGLNN